MGRVRQQQQSSGGGASTRNQNKTSVAAATQLFWTAYKKDTPKSLKLIDVYLLYILLSGIAQFIYMIVVGTFPYNAFLAGFISTVGSFVLAVNLRIQTNPKNADKFKTITPERAFADFVIASLLLHFFSVHYLG
ncbi:DAD/Ost2 [Phascolomyces articulosus]|uniref:Dolichyl-diphosphooligosaccharide--protein glycosyltransferase subunit OST2 n=1 Tax=Phascolomyces articulosus TaxID=60185 RepID=A0AAD5K465_9FUNG|nr:DAD/Ost2 [Phascolomyces articulosus]